MSPSSGEDLIVYNRRISIELQGEGANLSIFTILKQKTLRKLT
jgi:hypothetical protein